MKKNALLGMSLAALGVVYGDIGTSPLYAMNEIFFGHAKDSLVTNDVFGIVSIIFWVLTLIVSIKYIILVLRADSDGEGGVFSLFSILHNSNKNNTVTKVLATLLIISSGLLLGEGIITPPISIISAVEGLKVATTTFNPYIVPITIAILTGLFFIQSYGTHKIGKLFGPIIVVWFLSIGIIGLNQVVSNPGILVAINPIYAFQFLISHGVHTVFIVLGSVMLVMTGGEALFADMGHFGRKPIRLSWFALVYPALLLNYFGQGAFLLSGQEVFADNIFYSMVPKMVLIPMVILATLSTIIASQALISGAFSLISQAISLGLLPFTKIIHTHQDHQGQIYIPFVNWLLYAGCVILVLIFQSSSRLASAYGLSVSGVMLITSLSMIAITRYVWKWKWIKSLLVFVPFVIFDLTFLSANSLKLFEGGYVPISIGLVVLLVIKSWQWGRKQVSNTYDTFQKGMVKDLLSMKENNKYPEIPKAYIFMSPQRRDLNDAMPALMNLFIQRYGALPKHIILLTVVIEKHPYVKKEDRYEIINFGKVGKDFNTLASVTVKFGFMEDPNVEKVLQDLANHKLIQIDTNKDKWIIEVMHEKIYKDEVRGLNRVRSEVFKLLARFADSADHYFKLGDDEHLAIESVPVKLK
ncbi:KUP/HAK/KT family potassium transporter [Candidatus Dojkabacteria bacterium]|nr:KUP/HAK/KT family potassium transporter [Candidatus Dojkabacteria bacterium]